MLVLAGIEKIEFICPEYQKIIDTGEMCEKKSEKCERCFYIIDSHRLQEVVAEESEIEFLLRKDIVEYIKEFKNISNDLKSYSFRWWCNKIEDQHVDNVSCTHESKLVTGFPDKYFCFDKNMGCVLSGVCQYETRCSICHLADEELEKVKLSQS